MKYIIGGVVVIVVLILSAFLYVQHILQNNVVVPTEPIEAVDVPEVPVEEEPIDLTNVPERTVVAENLTIPWDVLFLPSGDLLITERSGTLVKLGNETSEVTEIPISGVRHAGEGGLLGAVLHPDFETNRYLYLYLTSTLDDDSVNTVLRYRYENDELSDETVIVENIPGALFHNGGRMAFGPDGYLYIATGDARDPQSSQDLDSLAGKLLRVTDDGGIPSDNPFGTMVYSYGHRNAQGLTWDDEGRLWSTEHGRSGAFSGLDELNLIEKGGNYGWPDSEGETVLPGTIGPALHSGADVTWAPGGAIYYDGSVFIPGLRGATLYEAVLDGADVVELREHFEGEFGRLRTILTGPDGTLYLTTSNRDGRGNVREGDDKVIRLNPLQFRE